MTNPYQSPSLEPPKSPDPPEKEATNVYGTVGCCLSMIPYLLMTFSKAKHILLIAEIEDVMFLVGASAWLAGLFCSVRGLAFLPNGLALLGLAISVLTLLNSMMISY